MKEIETPEKSRSNKSPQKRTDNRCKSFDTLFVNPYLRYNELFQSRVLELFSKKHRGVRVSLFDRSLFFNNLYAVRHRNNRLKPNNLAMKPLKHALSLSILPCMAPLLLKKRSNVLYTVIHRVKTVVCKL